METLLTPTESLAFQSFLTAVDGSQPSNDWSVYSSQFNPHHIRGDDHIILDPLPSAPANESLAKATKDLMSLDPAGWSDGSMVQQQQQQHYMYNHQMQQHTQPLLTQPLHRQHPYSSIHDPFPFLNPKASSQSNHSFEQQQPQQPYIHPQQQQHSINNSQLDSPTTPTDIYSFPNHQQHPQQQHLPSPLNGSHLQEPTQSTKRPKRPSSARNHSSSTASSSTTTRPRAPSQQQQQQARQSHSPQLNGTSQAAAKPALLSPSQKKANHIQSEQKRRANIRRGYEALCETVPALREAIREEEEEARLGAAQGSEISNGSGKGKAAGKKRATKKKDGVDGGAAAKDRIDGRAGPRSENVVLSKTIDYINDLLSERSTLLTRLQRARSMLPAGHPGLIPLSPNPPWEREWKGGEGKFADEEEEGDESEVEGEAEVEEEVTRSGMRSRPKRNSKAGG